MTPVEICHFHFLIYSFGQSGQEMPVEIYLSQRMDALKSVANSAKTLVMELFMDVNDIELFEESTRKAREEAELMKKKAGLPGEQVGGVYISTM